MQTQTAVIHVYRSHGCLNIIRHKTFCMDKTWRICVYFHSVFDQIREIRLCQKIHQFLIRNSRYNQTHIHAGFCRIYKCRTHLGSDDQIRSKDVKIFFCPADYIQIYIFADIFVIQWRIGIRLDESFFICMDFFLQPVFFHGSCPIKCIITFYFQNIIPQFQEHACKTPDTFSGQTDCRILPIPKTHSGIDILIRQVHSPGIGNLSVNHRDLPVIPVILDN